MCTSIDGSPRAVKDSVNLLIENRNMKLGRDRDRDRDRDKLEAQRIILEGRERKVMDFTVPSTPIFGFIL